MVEAGLKADAESSDVVFASSGMGALVYLSDQCVVGGATTSSTGSSVSRGAARCSQAPALEEVGHREDGGLAIAFAMARHDAPNRFGVPGISHVAGCRFSSIDGPGRGQHGGLGPYETNPVLIVDDGAGDERRIEARTERGGRLTHDPRLPRGGMGRHRRPARCRRPERSESRICEPSARPRRWRPWLRGSSLHPSSMRRNHREAVVGGRGTPKPASASGHQATYSKYRPSTPVT